MKVIKVLPGVIGDVIHGFTLSDLLDHTAVVFSIEVTSDRLECTDAFVDFIGDVFVCGHVNSSLLILRRCEEVVDH